MLITEHQFKTACFLYFIFTEKLKTLDLLINTFCYTVKLVCEQTEMMH